MKLIEINAFKVYETYDRDSTDVAYFSSKWVAHAYIASLDASEQGYYNVAQVNKTYIIFDSVLELQENSNTSIRKRALAKLTQEERDALGI